MPRTKSAIKKMRKDKKRTQLNKIYEKKYKEAIKKAKKTGDEKYLKEAYSMIDRAVKRKVIAKNKGSRLKSKVSKFLNKNTNEGKT